MRIAILLAGPYRGNQTIIDNHTKFIGNYDTYVSCLEHYREDWIRSNWPVKEIFITPNINFNETDWSKYRNDAPGQSGFWQFWNLKNVIDNTPTGYDWYIKSRCDLIFHSGQITEYMFTTLDKNTLYCPSNYFDGSAWDYANVLNDQFYVGDYNTMKIISDFASEYYKIQRHPLNQPIASNERNLRKYLDENNIHIKILKDMKYTKNHNGITTLSANFKYQLENI